MRNTILIGLLSMAIHLSANTPILPTNSHFVFTENITTDPNSNTAIRLNMAIKGTKYVSVKSFFYKIVGYTSTGEIVNIESDYSMDLESINTTIDPKIMIKKIGIKLSWENQNRYYVFDADKTVNIELDLNKAKVQ